MDLLRRKMTIYRHLAGEIYEQFTFNQIVDLREVRGRIEELEAELKDDKSEPHVQESIPLREGIFVLYDERTSVERYIAELRCLVERLENASKKRDTIIAGQESRMESE